FSLCFSVVLSSPSPPLALPSFPTRRSSDLVPGRDEDRVVAEPAGAARLADHPPAHLPLHRPLATIGQHERRRTHERPAPVLVGRSEEHTSELQSRENLVCRLLLEKKKNNTE